MRDALRTLSESFRDRLKRFDSTHNTDKYVRVYVPVCVCAACSFLLVSFLSHTQKRPLVYVLRIIISFRRLTFLCFRRIAIGRCETLFFIGAQSSERAARREKNSRARRGETVMERENAILIVDCKSTTIHMGDN